MNMTRWLLVTILFAVMNTTAFDKPKLLPFEFGRIQQIVDKLLQKNPDDRYQTAEQVHNDLIQLQIDSQLRFILPQDYVNWVRISQYTSGQVLIPMTEKIQTNWSGAYLQDNNYKILFDIDGNVLKPNQSKLTIDRIAGTAPSIYTGGGAYDGQSGYNVDGCWYFDYGIGARFGMNTETANSNPTFSIDKKGGVINFSSGLEGEFIVLEYVSDGLESGDDSSVSVNKMFEEFLYAYVKYSILNSKLGVQ